MIGPFEAPRLKLERAAKHLGELEASVAAYFSERPCRLIVERFPVAQPHLPCQAWTARISKPVPLELASIIGDVVHNLRASLDMLACDLVRLKGHDLKNVYFPFCDRREDLLATIKKRRMHLAGDDVVKVIEALAPHRKGNLALRALHDMDIADKHRALIPMLGGTSVPLGPILNAPPNFAAQTWHSLVTDGQQVIMLPERLSPVKVGDELPAKWFLSFADAPGLGNVLVIETLHWLSTAVRDAHGKLTGLRPYAAFPAPEGST